MAGAVRHRGDQPDTATSCPRRGACITPTFWDCATFSDTIGLFLTLLFLFIRFLPVISIAEMRELVLDAERGHSQTVKLPRGKGRR